MGAASEGFPLSADERRHTPTGLPRFGGGEFSSCDLGIGPPPKNHWFRPLLAGKLGRH